ncbi:MAG: hypothetical protein R3B13_13610 [Polyangiaceae bacterium]
MVRTSVPRGLTFPLAMSLLALAAPAAAQTTQVAVASPARASLARTVRMTLRVDRAEEGHAALREVASRYGRLYREDQTLVVMDITQQNEDAARRSIAQVGEVVDERRSTQDVSDRIERERALLRAAVSSQERLLRMTAGNVSDGLALERARADAAQQVETQELTVREWERRSQFTRFELRLQFTPVDEVRPSKLPFDWLDTVNARILADPGGVERRDRRELRNLLDGAFRLEGVHAERRGELPKNLNTLSATVDMRILGEATPVGIFGGVDAGLGGGSGFSYDLQLMLGGGIPFGQRFALGVASGPGIDGVTSTIPFGVTFPVELFLSWDVSSFIAAKARAQSSWVLAAEARKNGTDLFPFADELRGGVYVIAAERDREGGYSEARDGVELGFEYRELMGAQAFVLTLGYGGHISDFSGRL